MLVVVILFLNVPIIYKNLPCYMWPFISHSVLLAVTRQYFIPCFFRQIRISGKTRNHIWEKVREWFVSVMFCLTAVISSLALSYSLQNSTKKRRISRYLFVTLYKVTGVNGYGFTPSTSLQFLPFVSTLLISDSGCEAKWEINGNLLSWTKDKICFCTVHVPRPPF